jgi:mono/diheme cytochrome c family protein
MGFRGLRAALAAGLLLLAGYSMSQETQTDKPNGAEQPTPYPNMTQEQRAKATRAFLGLGAEPDRAAAARGEPLFENNCAVCHGAKARGAMGPSLITSDEVLDDTHGEHLGPYIKAGRPEKGMPAFFGMEDGQRRDIAEFLHLQVEEVANRGAYRVLNIVVGDPQKGHAYVSARCMTCHKAQTFAHFARRFATPEQLQRGWIWPRGADNKALPTTAAVKTAGGAEISGRVTEVSDFRIVLVDSSGSSHTIDREPGVVVEMNDPLEAHQKMITTLKNDDMHNVTAYLETLK